MQFWKKDIQNLATFIEGIFNNVSSQVKEAVLLKLGYSPVKEKHKDPWAVIITADDVFPKTVEDLNNFYAALPSGDDTPYTPFIISEEEKDDGNAV